jgi:hypothetical protein
MSIAHEIAAISELMKELDAHPFEEPTVRTGETSLR